MIIITCHSCGTQYNFTDTYLYQCTACGGILRVHYSGAVLEKVDRAYFTSRLAKGVDAYRELLPLRAAFPWPTLGEGGTPLVSCSKIAHEYGVAGLLAKHEGMNPSGSFKDRPLSVAVAKAIECGADTVITSSSGNAGAAMAAYAARAGLSAVVVVPQNTPLPKLRQIAAHGGVIVSVNADVGGVWKFARQVAGERGWVNVATTFLSPFPTEGNKTVAYELAVQLGWSVPDWVLVPVGAGPLLAGIYSGFQELVQLGLVDRIPRLVAVQATGCSPIATAFDAGEKTVGSWSRPDTVAKAIADPLTGYEQDGTYTLELCRDTGGAAISVSDDEIAAAMRLAANKEGLFVEPTAATAIAGVKVLKDRGYLSAQHSAVSVITGHGLKSPEIPGDRLETFPAIEPTLEAFNDLWTAAS